MGDVLMTAPALRALRVSAPGRRLTLLTSPSGAQAAELIREVDETWTYNAPWVKNPLSSVHAAETLLERIRGARFDAAVIFTVYSQNPLPSALLAFLGNIPLRLAHCRENPYHLLTNWVPETEPEKQVRHEVQRQLDLVAEVGARTSRPGIELHVPPEPRQRVRDLLTALELPPERPFVVLHPGATAESRRYPVDRFATVAHELSRHRIPVLITGSESEAPLAEAILRDAPHRHENVVGLPGGAGFAPIHSLCGVLTLPELAALIASSSLVISNNSGPVHVAAGVGTPVVDLYALTNPQHTPWRVPHRVLFRDVPCKYCYKSVCPQLHHLCLSGVDPSDVVVAAFELLQPMQGSLNSSPNSKGAPYDYLGHQRSLP